MDSRTHARPVGGARTLGVGGHCPAPPIDFSNYSKKKNQGTQMDSLIKTRRCGLEHTTHAAAHRHTTAHAAAEAAHAAAEAAHAAAEAAHTATATKLLT